MPPSLVMSRSLRSLSLPVPTTTRRGTLRPEGAMMSSVDPFLPVKRSAAAARRTRSPDGSSARRVAGPNFKLSPQNVTRTPRSRSNGVKPSFKASDMRQSFSSDTGRRALPWTGRCHALLFAPNGFALSRPLCRKNDVASRMKSRLPPPAGIRHQAWRRGRRVGRHRGSRTDGVDRPLHLSHHHGCVSDHPRQPDRWCCGSRRRCATST